jgi:hypothetical protein
MEMKNLIFPKVVEILNEIQSLNFEEPCPNERYLHHYFTGKIQAEYPDLIIYTNKSRSKLHPEWATKGKYKKNKESGNKYEICNNGSPGFVDFTLGEYENPELGIEFKVSKGWQFQSLVFDYMKLMDNQNLFNKVISFAIIYRDKGLSNQLTLDKIKETIVELSARLGSKLDENRPFLFKIIEVANDNNKRCWICDNIAANFRPDTAATAEIRP